VLFDVSLLDESSDTHIRFQRAFLLNHTLFISNEELLEKIRQAYARPDERYDSPRVALATRLHVR
jgi:hypothetical protein